MRFHIFLSLILSITSPIYALDDFDSGPGNAKIFRITALEEYVKKIKDEIGKVEGNVDKKYMKEIEAIKKEIVELKSKEVNNDGLAVLEKRIDNLELKHADEMKKMEAELRNFKQSIDQSLLDLSNKILQRIQIFEKYLQKPAP